MSHSRDGQQPARRTVGGALARHPRAGYTLFVLSFLVFAILTYEVVTNGPLIRYDEPMSQAFHTWAEHSPAWVVSFMKLGSSLGFWGVIVTLPAFAILWLVRRQWRELTMLVLGAAGGQVLFDIIAAVVARPRPHFPNPFEGLTANSFPSGHVVSSTLLYGLLLYVFVPRIRQPAVRVLLVLLGVLLLAWIAVSRLFLGSHYVSDIVAGFAMGLAWGFLVYTATEVYYRDRGRRAVDPASTVSNASTPTER